MRRLIIPLALMLALTTGVVLDETRLTALAPIEVVGVSPDSSTNGIVVRHFYDAVNIALTDGDTSPLNRIVAPDYVDHVSRPGVSPDRSGLIAYLAVLRTADAGVRLVTDQFFAQDDRVVTLVSLDGADGSAPADISPGVERAWGDIDVFRVKAGRITEHWGDATGLSHAVRLLDFTIPTNLPVGSVVQIDRKTLPPDSTWQQTTSGPTIFLVESGALSVELQSTVAGAAVVRSGQVSEALMTWHKVTLAPADMLALPDGAVYRVTIGEDLPAVALVLWTAPQAHDPGLMPSDMSIGNQTWQSHQPFDGKAGSAVAGGLPVDLPGGGIRVTFNRYALAPAAALAAHRVALAELTVVLAGTLDIAAGGGLAWVRHEGGDALWGTTESAVGPGGGVQVEAGVTASYRSAGDTPVEFLLISISGPATYGTAAPTSGM